MYFTRKEKRRNGFDRPFSRDQILSTSFYLISIILNFIIIIGGVDPPLIINFIVISGVLTLITLIAWVNASIIDPESNNKNSRSLNPCIHVQRSNSFCIDCNKSIYRMDHHCSFLNNCIGEKNYHWFIGLLIIGVLQMGFQFFIAIASAIEKVPYTHSLSFTKKCQGANFFLLSIQALICLIFIVGLISLCVFHCYLVCYVRRGTYDWILLGRQNRLYSLQNDSNERSTSLTESRIREMQRQREREKFAKQLEEARKKRHEQDHIDTELQIVSRSRDTEEENDHSQPRPQSVLDCQISPQITIVPEIMSDTHNITLLQSVGEREGRKSSASSLFFGTFAFRGKDASIYPSEIDSQQKQKNGEESRSITQRPLYTTLSQVPESNKPDNHSPNAKQNEISSIRTSRNYP